MSAVTEAPRWDMTPYFPSLQSTEFEQEFASLKEATAQLGVLFNHHQIGPDSPGRTPEQTAEVFDEVTVGMNTLTERMRLVGAYIAGFVTTDSRDTLAQAKESELQLVGSDLAKLNTRLTAWLGTVDVEALILKSGVAESHSFAVRKAHRLARHQMSMAEEMLAAELKLSGSTAWAKLHGNVTSQLEVTLEIGGRTESIPMSSVRNYAMDSDRSVRKAAYDAELDAWSQVDVILAASMNGIKGESLTLLQKRGWDSPLDEACFTAHMSRQALDAMMRAAQKSFPDFRRYLNAKARKLGIPGEKLAFYDLFAPIGASSRAWDYQEACDFVAEQFGTYSSKLREFAERSYRENWIDVAPRPGKRDGAFCMGTRGDESRVLLNYVPSFKWVSTLAHELGHAYHNVCLATRTPYQKQTPMTLAETASIFCETIIKKGALQTASPEEKLDILETSLMGACQVVVDISSRFLFEEAVFKQRKQRELSPQELCELMIWSQKETYGDGLDSNALHPYMWAAKPHYYGRAFYNFPYMFGLLFGLGLYAQYQTEPDAFRSNYDDLLSSTGMDDAASLGRRFGIDIESEEFWAQSLQVVRQDIDEFERLTR